MKELRIFKDFNKEKFFANIIRQTILFTLYCLLSLIPMIFIGWNGVFSWEYVLGNLVGGFVGAVQHEMYLRSVGKLKE